MADFPSSEGSGSHTIIPPTRRPDGSLRKPIRVRAGYVPQDEIGAWESPAKRMQREREAVGVPGWDDAPSASTPSISYTSSSMSRGIVGGEGIVSKPSSSSAAAALTKTQKRNMARKKGREEKRQQEQPSVEDVTAALAKTKISSPKQGAKTGSRSTQPTAASASTNSADDLSKKVKALQKKLRQVEQLQARVDAGEVSPTDEQREKLNKRTQFEKELSDLQTALDATTAKQ